MEELNRLSVAAFKASEKTPIVLVLDDIRSGLNVGSMFRTADAFAAAEVVLSGYTAQPPHREILKTALGSTESVSWRHFGDIATALNALRSEGYLLVALEQTEDKIWLHELPQHIDTQQKYALIFGNEVDGVSHTALEMADMVIEIPQYGTKHSLNVAVTAGIVAWSFAKHYHHAPTDKVAIV